MKGLIRHESSNLNKLMNVVFYIMLAVLILFLIYPYTSLRFRTNLFNPFSERLNKEDVILVSGESFHLYVYGFNKKVTYRSSDFKVCEVGLNGRIYAHKIGTAIIKVKYENKVLKCRVRVIDINKTSISLKEGDSYQLEIKGINKRVKWTSSNKSVATIDRKGKVKAVSKGKTVITGVIKGKTLKCVIKVK